MAFNLNDVVSAIVSIVTVKDLPITHVSSVVGRGGARNLLTGGCSSDEGAKIWFSGYYKCQKSQTKSILPYDGG